MLKEQKNAHQQLSVPSSPFQDTKGQPSLFQRTTAATESPPFHALPQERGAEPSPFHAPARDPETEALRHRVRPWMQDRSPSVLGSGAGRRNGALSVGLR